MTNRKTYLILFIGSLLTGAIAATQYVAWAYGYNPRLGWQIVSMDGQTIYWPFAFVFWMLSLAKTGPQILNIADLIFILCLVPALLVVVVSVRRDRRRIPVFAPEAWGKKIDARKASILKSGHQGVILGKWDRSTLSYGGPEHQIVAGASRSGKGAGHVIPTLLNWHESVFVYDPKAECYDITGAFRSKFSHAFYLNFTRRDTAAYNPLDMIRKGDMEIADIQNIVSILHDPAGTKEEPNFFDRAAMTVLTAIIMHTLYASPPAQKNLAGVRTAIMRGDATIAEMASMAHYYRPDAASDDGFAHDEAGQQIPVQIPEVALIGDRLLAMPPRLRGDILETALSYLTVWADPIVAEMTSRTDFTPGDLVCSDHPASLYLQVPPADDDRLKPLTRLILSQFAAQLMIELDRDAENRPKRHKLLFLIDEFPSLGKLGFFSRNMRVMAGYGIKAMLTVQSFKDIIDAYGPNNTILDNCHVTVAFASADNETARKISEMIGEPIEHRVSYSTATGDRGIFQGRNTRSVAETQRKLLEPGEVRQLPYDTQLILVTGSKPFKTKKIRYWLEEPWKSRATDIRSGQRGPDQAARLDVPREGGFTSVWQTIKPLNLTVKQARPVNQEEEPAQDIERRLTDLQIDVPDIGNEAGHQPEYS